MLTFDYGIKFSPPQAAKNMGFLCKEGGGQSNDEEVMTGGGRGVQTLEINIHNNMQMLP